MIRTLLLVLCLCLPVTRGFYRARGMPASRYYASKEIDANFIDLKSALKEIGLDASRCDGMLDRIAALGFTNTNELLAIAVGFVDKEDKFSKFLQDDFEIKALDSHLLRSAVMKILKNKSLSFSAPAKPNTVIPTFVESNVTSIKTPSKYEKVRVTRSSYFGKDHVYAIKDNEMPKKITEELDHFLVFMTEMSPVAQEAPIRSVTAMTYLKHAQLFLGWYLKYEFTQNEDINELSINKVFLTKEKESAQVIFKYIKWLRLSRKISISYEANTLRGLIKFLKFRFSNESTTDPSYGDKSYVDIPIIREVRKLHREAGAQTKLAPKVAYEEQKWLSWEDYLGVVQRTKEELKDEKAKLSALTLNYQVAQKRSAVAQVFQRYLLLSFFKSIPDRQRTFRELQIGVNFIRKNADESRGLEAYWVIQHSADDYKTGKAYGERPPLQLPSSLTKDIDEYVSTWRPLFMAPGDQSINYFFLQPKTGKQLRSDSIYQMVSNQCFKYSGKKTNPHLLRDMVVTYARGTAASEKELESLALFMGHSIAMQRSSYDRRTLKDKVSPAFDLLTSLNNVIK